MLPLAGAEQATQLITTEHGAHAPTIKVYPGAHSEQVPVELDIFRQILVLDTHVLTLVLATVGTRK